MSEQREWYCAVCCITNTGDRCDCCSRKYEPTHPAPAELVGVDDGRKYTIDAAGRMIPDDEHPFRGPAASEPRVFWYRQEDFSNRALIRDGSEKWPDDVKGEPSSAWTKAVDFSAYEALERERNNYHDQWYADAKRLQEAEQELAEAKRELEQVDADRSQLKKDRAEQTQAYLALKAQAEELAATVKGAICDVLRDYTEMRRMDVHALVKHLDEALARYRHSVTPEGSRSDSDDGGDGRGE